MRRVLSSQDRYKRSKPKQPTTADTNTFVHFQNPTLGVGLYLVKLKDTPEKDAFLQSIKQAQALMVKAGLEKCSALIRQTTQEEVVTKEVVDENIFTTFSTHGYVGSSRNDPLIDLGPVKLIIATYRDADSAAHRLKNARIAVSSTIDSNITAIRAKLYNGRAAFEVAGSTLSVQFTIPGSKTERSEALKLASSSNQTETGSLNEQCSDSPSFFTVVVKLADAATAADVAGRVATMRDILPVHPDDTVEGDDGAGDSGKSGAAQTDARPEPKPAGRVGLKWAAVPPPAGGATPASGSGSPVRVSQSGASSGAWYKAGWVASRVAFFNDCARRAAGSVTGPVGRRRKVSATVQAAQQQQQTPATEEEPRESNALLKAACGEDIASYSPVCEETEVPASKVGGAFSLPAGDAESAASDVTSKTSIEPTVGAAVAAEPLSTDDLMVVERLDGDVTIAAQDIYERLFEQSALSKESYWGGVNEKRCYYFPPVGIPQELVVAWSRIPYEAQKLLAGGANQVMAAIFVKPTKSHCFAQQGFD
ncbi:hypothetical protein DFJ73DRAFT_214327 [Zopfochytrium polystomum]|nr:hypothetical protein DFJ73DRAFT_214327 [Zopfochytrium polystomum]